MVERVAKAVGDIAYGYVDSAGTPTTWDMSVVLARVAIAAMREPTKTMIDAGHDADEWGESNGDCGSHWKLMIDAALKQPTAK